MWWCDSPMLQMIEPLLARSAPSYSLFGAFFPAWLFCALIGLAACLTLRGTLIAIRLDDTVPFKLLVYTAFAVSVTLVVWLTLFGER